MVRRYLRRFLEVNWLKPFDAVWDASVASVLESVSFEEPSLDVGCGDGLFMLVVRGGRARLSYDRYTDTELRLRGDFYNTRASVRQIAATPPPQPLTVGLDHKAGLLDKARRTATYRYLIQGDGQALPFADRSFSSVFCNILHWLPDWGAGLREMRRVLKDDGRLVLVVPNATVGEQLLSYHRAQRYRAAGRPWRARFFDWIDNSRFYTLTRLTGDAQTWQARLAEAGLMVSESHPAVSTGVVRRWDFSTRPVLHVLVVLSRGLQTLHLKSVVKRLVLPLLEWRTRGWVARSLQPPPNETGLWVIVSQPCKGHEYVSGDNSAERILGDTRRDRLSRIVVSPLRTTRSLAASDAPRHAMPME